MKLPNLAMKHGEMMTVAMKLHNLAMKHGATKYAYLYGADITRERDPMALDSENGKRAEGEGAGAARHDYLGHRHESTILISSPNPKLAQVEAARGQAKAARLAREPAWEQAGHGKSPRDPEKRLNLPCAPRPASTQQLMWQSDARQAATDQMKALGYARGTKVHWK